MSASRKRPSLASVLSALRGSPIGIFAFRPDGRVRSLSFNRRLTALQGLDLRVRREIGGVSASTWRRGVARVLAGEAVRERLRSEGAVAELRVEPWRDADGRVIGGVGLSIDVTAREEARQGLEAQQRRLRRITDHMGDVLAEFDLKGRLRFVTPSVGDLYQRAPEEVLHAADPIRFLHPDDRERVRDALRRAVRTRRGFSVDSRVLRADGSVRWTTSRAEFVQTAEGEPRILVFTRDVTEARQAQRRRERRAALVRRISELSHELLALTPQALGTGLERALERVLVMTGADACVLHVVDPHTGEPCHFRAARPGVEGPPLPARHDVERMRWLLPELMRTGSVCIPAPDAWPPEARVERTVAERDGVRSLLALGVQSDAGLAGSLHLVGLRAPREFPEDEHPPLRVLAEMLVGACRRRLTFEATERGRVLEAQVARLSQRLMRLHGTEPEAAFPEAMELAMRIARADFALLRLSRAEGGAELRRFTASEGEPLPAPDLGRLRWMEAELAAGRRVVLSRGLRLPEAGRRDLRHLRELGAGSCLAVPLRPAEAPAGWLAVLSRDAECRWSEEERGLVELVAELLARVLDREAAERRLQERQAELRQSQKMDAVGRLAGGIAHEFNNLLMVMSGHAESLAERLDPQGEPAADLGEIRGATDRAAALTRQLLTLSGPDLGRPGPVAVDALVREDEGMWRRTLGERCDLELRLGAGEAAVLADRSDLEQILLNLLVNARDAMPEGGTVVVTTRREEPGGGGAAADAGRARDAPAWVEISVQDEGKGIAEQHLPHIFEPFFSTKPPGRGTGLGLSIVRHAAERVGAQVLVESRPGDGTRFRVRIPESRERSKEVCATRRPAPRAGSGTLLLAEDEDGVRRLMRRILERAGYRVLEARDGVEALERLLAGGDRIDAVVSDVVMPRLGGGGLLQALRERNLALPVLLVSGYPQEVDGPPETPAERPLLYKPFSAEELLRAVAELLA